MKMPTFKAPTFKKMRPKLAHEIKAPDPLKKLKEEPDIEKSAKQEVDAVAQGFRDRAAQEATRMDEATDAGFYVVLVFEDSSQVDVFMEECDMAGNDEIFIDGREFAEKIGRPLQRMPGARSVPKIDKRLAKLAGQD